MTNIDSRNSSEKNCRWHFAPQSGGRDDGPNDAMMQNFRSKPYQALVREAVQNSLDAVNDPTLPVRVEITFSSLGSSNFPNFFKLKEHITECKHYYHWNENAVAMYTFMERMFNSDRLNHSLDYIKVADYNTKGMDYTPGSTESRFYAFARAAGVSSKIGQQSGGSFGFGKSAYFQLSDIGTVFISTLTAPQPNQPSVSAFEGVAWLCSHQYNGEKVSSVGFYDNNNGQPITDDSMIPARLSRKGEPGTSFYIMGYDRNKKLDAVKDMMEEALRSFWMAIYCGKLTIQIDDQEINRDTLETHLKEYLPEELDNTRKAGYYKPLPYFNAVRYAETSKDARKFVESLPILGECTLYLIKKQDAKDKIVYMRRPLMLVYSKRMQTSYGVFGVFVCENTKGDQVLRNMENPAHDEWKAGNWRNDRSRIHPDGEQALLEIQEFIKRCLSQLFTNAEDTALDITGLEDLLYIPEGLIDDSDDSDHKLGQPTGNIKDDGLSMTSDIVENASIPKVEDDSSNIGSVRISLPGSSETTDPQPDEDDTVIAGIGGHKRKRSRTKGGKPTAGNQFEPRKIVNPDGTYKVFLPVEFRVIAQDENGKYYHNIIIHSPQDVIEGEIELVTIGEQSDDIVSIESTDNGAIRDNFLYNVVLEEGKNVIKILFSDNMRHAIKLKAYEHK
ncbi:MAG: hypothetical protein HDT05_06135 [Bacteroidales bacterium]|nr:hypothetical protein [Bacteroidales bacterium]